MLTALMLVASAICGADPADAGQTGATSIRIEPRVQREFAHAIGYLDLLASKSGRIVAVRDRHRDSASGVTVRWHLFTYSESDDTWEGPFEWSAKGFDFDSQRSIEWRTDATGRDLLCETISPHRALVVDGGTIRVLDAPPELAGKDTSLAQWRAEKLPIPVGPEGLKVGAAPERAASIVRRMVDHLRRNADGSALPEDLELRDLALNGDRVLYSHGYYTKAYLLDLAKGLSTTLDPGNGRLKGDYWAYPRFSPCERYVLVQYNYTGDSNHPVPAGMVQLFTSNGQFITEVVEWKVTGGFIYGCADWLCSNWIVYTTPNTVVFAKVLDGTGAKNGGPAK